MTTERAPTLDERLQGAPTAATRAHRAIHALAEEANAIVRLLDLMRNMEPELRDDAPGGDTTAHLKAIGHGFWLKATGLLVAYGVPKRA